MGGGGSFKRDRDREIRKARKHPNFLSGHVLHLKRKRRPVGFNQTPFSSLFIVSGLLTTPFPVHERNTKEANNSLVSLLLSPSNDAAAAAAFLRPNMTLSRQ